MELLFNSLWLFFVLAGGMALLRARSGHSTAKRLAALACVAVLLFPAISITDDLHPDFIAVEDAARRIVHVQAPAALLHLHVASLLPVLKLAPSGSALSILSPAVFPANDGFVRPVTGRAPPVASA